MMNSLKYSLGVLKMSIVVTYNPETKRFTIDYLCKGITAICSASKVYFQVMKTTRRRRVEKRRKECKEKNLPEPRNTPMTGTEEILDTLVKDITKGSANLTHQGIRSIESKKSNQQLSRPLVMRGEVMCAVPVSYPPMSALCSLA